MNPKTLPEGIVDDATANALLQDPEARLLVSAVRVKGGVVVALDESMTFVEAAVVIRRLMDHHPEEFPPETPAASAAMASIGEIASKGKAESDPC